MGMDLMIVVDVSGTMKNSIDDAKTFARSVVDGLKLGTNDEQTRVGIAQFSNDVGISRFLKIIYLTSGVRERGVLGPHFDPIKGHCTTAMT